MRPSGAPWYGPAVTTATLAPPAAVDPADLEDAIDRAADALIAKQAPGGWWVGELQGDSILESEYILLKWILGQEGDPDLVKVANYLRRPAER